MGWMDRRLAIADHLTYHHLDLLRLGVRRTVLLYWGWGERLTLLVRGSYIGGRPAGHWRDRPLDHGAALNGSRPVHRAGRDAVVFEHISALIVPVFERPIEELIDLKP